MMQIVDILLSRGADVNKEDNNSMRPLAQACHSNNPRIVKRIIGAGADVNDPDNNGITALHIACERGYNKLVEILVDNGADITLKDHKGRTGLSAAVNNGDIKRVTYLLRKHAEQDRQHGFLYSKDNRGRTILHKASAKGYNDVIKEILKYGNKKRLLAQKDFDLKATPLHPAAFRNHLESIKLLIEAGADPFAENADGETPVEVAVNGHALGFTKDTEAIKFLMTACREDLNLIQRVMMKGGYETSIVKAALDLGPVDLEEKDFNGWTLMLCAVQAQRDDLIELLHANGVWIIDLELESRIYRNELLGYEPTRFDVEKMAESLILSVDNKVVTLRDNPWDRGHAIQANFPFPAGYGVYYFEVEILPEGDEQPEVSIGLGHQLDQDGLATTEQGRGCLHYFPRGYNSINGRIYSQYDDLDDEEVDDSIDYGPCWGKGDVVGCLLDFEHGNIMFTKNDELLGIAFRDFRLKGRFATVAMRTCNSVRVNFGHDPEIPFKFDWEIVDLEKIARREEKEEGGSASEEDEKVLDLEEKRRRLRMRRYLF